MPFNKKFLAVSVIALLPPLSYADDQNVPQLVSINVTAHAADRSEEDVVDHHIITKDQLIQGGTTIGDALNGQPGIYAGQYSGGVSHPVVRGQDGARVKIVQNGGDTLDVSSLSPDHAVTVDPNSSDKIEVLQGPAQLLYSAGSVGGLVNVIDQKIPQAMPKKPFEGQVGTRYNSGNDELLSQAQITAALGDSFVLRLAGLKRDANDYIAPDNYVTEDHGDHSHTTKERRVDSTFAKSNDYDVGLSWVYDRGYTGISFSQRHDKYGIPADNELYGACELSGLKLDCPTSSSEDDHDHEHDSSWINLKSKTYALKSELSDPFAGFSHLKFQTNYTDYQHQEMHGDVAETTFKSKGTDTRLELKHKPIDNWEGTLGASYTRQKVNIEGDEALMDPSTTQKYSIFALEHRPITDTIHFELGARVDHQKIDIDSTQKDFDGTALSASAATSWNFAPNYKLVFTASHQERLPMAQELYANGKHMATNTYELGNEDLNKEKSNNLELGLHFDNDKLSYQAHIFQNWFDNFIYAKTLDQFQDFRLIQYSQDKATFWGADASISYQLSEIYKATIFGDYVRAKLDDAGNVPRIPGGRVGTRVNADFGNGYTGSAEYYHVFNQDDIANYETATQGYNMVNLGVAYNGKWAKQNDYKLFAKANNLLDETVYQHESFVANVPQIGRNFVVGFELGF